MLVLLVGILGVLKLLDGALAGTSGNNARVAATNLGRELAETTRALDYDELTPALLAGRLQARGLGSSSPWTIARRGVTYTIQERVCTYDDGADQIAASAPDNVCSPLPTAATGDENGDDFRRVSFDISWRDQGRTRSLTHTDLVVNPSGGLGPHITSFSPLTQTITAPVGTATIQYVSDAAASLHWRADNGEDEADATGGPTNWTVNWDIRALDNGTEVLDGTYRVTLRGPIQVPGSAWIAARVSGRMESWVGSPRIVAAHTSPVYVVAGGAELFSPSDATYMLTLIEGGLTWLDTLAIPADPERHSRARRVFEDARTHLHDRLHKHDHGHAHHDHSGSESL